MNDNELPDMAQQKYKGPRQNKVKLLSSCFNNPPINIKVPV